MRVTINVPPRPRALDALLEGLVALNVAELEALDRNGTPAPLLYESGVRYEREPAGREWWQSIADNLRTRVGDCEDLAGHRAAELRYYYGIPARAVTVETGPRAYHAIVQYPDGRLEDPSRILMRRRRRTDKEQRMPTRARGVHAFAKRLPDGTYRATIVLTATRDTGHRVSGPGSTVGHALARAAKLAARVARDPHLLALLPPGTPVALEAASKLAAAAKSGKLKTAWRKFKGPAMRRLARELGAMHAARRDALSAPVELTSALGCRE